MLRGMSVLIVLSLLLSSFLVEGKAEALEMSGFLKLDERFNVGGDRVTVADMYNTLRLEFKAALGEKLFAFSSLDFRFYNFPRIEGSMSLGDRDREYPLDFSLWEAYAELYGFLFENLDLKLGRQRIAWGTADKLNPTDNLNPDDFSDPLTFGEKLPTMAVKATYYLGEYTLTGVWLPSLQPVLLPEGGLASFGGGAPMPPGREGMEIVSFRDSVILPDRTPGNGMLGFKLSGNLLNWDVSLSYFKGYDDLPIPQRMVLTPVDLAAGSESYDVSLYLGFPKMQVLGLDFAGEFRSLGLWGEGALFLPEEVRTRVETPEGGQPQVWESTALPDDPYPKFTFGFDYTFRNGIYINGQYMHGFFTERGSDDLEDYLIARVERKFRGDEIQLALGGALEVKDTGDVVNSYGTGVFPEVRYYPSDNVGLSLGAFVLGGKEGTLFGSWKDRDQAYLRVKVGF